jgi:hypothetical protein
MSKNTTPEPLLNDALASQRGKQYDEMCDMLPELPREVHFLAGLTQARDFYEAEHQRLLARLAILEGKGEDPWNGHADLPYLYRPNKHDDWGVLRCANGWPVASAKMGRDWTEEEWEAHRAAKTDPMGDTALFIAHACNTYYPTQARLRSLTEAAQVAADALEEMREPDWAQEYREKTCDQALSLLSLNGVVPGGG